MKRLFDAAEGGTRRHARSARHRLVAVALGEATKTVPLRDGRPKALPLHRRAGVSRRHRRYGRQSRRASDDRPTEDEILAALPEFTGEIMQMPPRFSAHQGRRRARLRSRPRRRNFELEPREIDPTASTLVENPDPDHPCSSRLRQGRLCSRARARPRPTLGTLAMSTHLRRTLAVGPFARTGLRFRWKSWRPWAITPSRGALRRGALLPVATALDDIPALAVTEKDAVRREPFAAGRRIARC